MYSQYRDCDRWADIVGVSKYQYPNLNLRYADQDAEELYKLLLTPNGGGFQSDYICKLTNEQATTGNITRALRSFLKKPAREDLVLIYFACHGSPDPDRPGNVYLLTYDTDPNDIAGTALPMEDIDRALKTILHSEKVIILADTCHSAAIGGGIGGRRRVGNDAQVMNRFLQDISRSKGGVALLTSAEANEVSFEDTKWGGGHGVFTHYLLEGMRGAADRDGNGIVTIGELFEYVRDNVKRATDYRQHPSIGTNAYDRSLPIAIAPNVNSSNTARAYQHSQNATGSRSSATGMVQENLDITFEIALTIEEMSAGTEKHIVTEQGGITVKIPAGVSSGKRIRVRGKGRFDARIQQQGDLYLLITQRSSSTQRQTSERQEKLKQQDVQELFSEREIDYTQLRKFLKAQDWSAADQETAKQMLKVSGKGSWFEIRTDDLLNFPCADLKTINSLWEKHSLGLYSFSAQKQIYVECGAKVDSGNPGDEIWKKFGDRVGWRKDGEWLDNPDACFVKGFNRELREELEGEIDADGKLLDNSDFGSSSLWHQQGRFGCYPKGFFPAVWVHCGLPGSIAVKKFGWVPVSVLFQRLSNCKI